MGRGKNLRLKNGRKRSGRRDDMIHLSYFICGFDSKDQSIDLSTNATNAIKEQFKGASKLHINIVFRLHFKQNEATVPYF